MPLKLKVTRTDVVLDEDDCCHRTADQHPVSAYCLGSSVILVFCSKLLGNAQTKKKPSLVCVNKQQLESPIITRYYSGTSFFHEVFTYCFQTILTAVLLRTLRCQFLLLSCRSSYWKPRELIRQWWKATQQITLYRDNFHLHSLLFVQSTARQTVGKLFGLLIYNLRKNTGAQIAWLHQVPAPVPGRSGLLLSAT